MIVTIKTDRLQVGMFVDFSDNWAANPFKEAQFEIASEEQINKIKNAGIKEINVNASRSTVSMAGIKEMAILNKEKELITFDEKIKHEDEIKKLENEQRRKLLTPPKWEPEKIIPKKLLLALKKKNLDPNIRAKATYQYSLLIMKHIFENPTYEVISSSKQGLAAVVEIIMTESRTSTNLVNIVSHDSFMHTHSVNVGIKSLLLAKNLFARSAKHSMHELAIGFFLHDIGKAKIDPNIVNKEGKFTPEEFKIIQTHPYISYKMLSEMKLVDPEVLSIVMQHHERDDGTGYPTGLRGKAIHPYARICCIADIFDALTAKRSYNKQLTLMQALTVMKGEMKAYFNQQMFKQFVMLFTCK